MFGLPLINEYKIPKGSFAYIKSYASNYGNSSTPGLTLPSVIPKGDLIVIFIGSNYGVSTRPTGFTTLRNDGGSYHSAYIGYKIATGSEGGTTITATNSGSQQWDFWGVIISDGKVYGYNGARATTGTSLSLGTAVAKTMKLVITFASARVVGRTLTSSLGELISARTADAALSSAFYAGYAPADSVSITIGSPASTSGISGEFVTFE